MGSKPAKIVTEDQAPLAAQAANERPFRDELLEVAKERKGHSKRGMRALANKLFDAAEEGDVTAIREIGDRIDGKPTKFAAGEGDKQIIIVLKSFAA